MFPAKNERFLRTIRRQPVDATPVWIMRQAGRYLPEYRQVRTQAGSFMKLCQTPELACEVTLQPLRRYALDASIIFSDILTIPDAMGLGLHFIEGKGPLFSHPLTDAASIHQLSVPEPEQLQYVYDAIRLVVRELNGRIPLIGFCGSPWTLAAYMIEGCSRPNFPKLQAMRLESPALLQHLLSVLAKAVSKHLQAQIDAGCQAVMIFDTWGGLLDDSTYPQFSLRYMQDIVKEIKLSHPTIPVILFTKGGQRWLELLAATECDVLGIDWEISLEQARARVGTQVALQGNLAPDCLRNSPEQIQAAVANVLQSYGKGSGHIFNLGHGITPDINPDHVSVLVDAVHEYSQPYHL